MKKLTKIILIALTLALLLAVPFAVYASDDEPSLEIEAANLSFMDSISILYAVSGENVDMSEVKLLIWTAPKSGIDEYVKGSEAHFLDSERYDSIDGVNCKVFDFDKLGAHQMTDEFYARAYVEVGGKVYYSNLSKYSVIRYAHNKLGYTGTATENEILISTLESMLEYGATVQLFADYKTDRLPTDRYYKITVEGGVLEDGTTSGLYRENESVSVKSYDGTKSHNIEVKAQNVIADAETGDTKIGFHTCVPAATVKENEIPATCGKDGSYDEVVYCSLCNKEISRTTEILSKTNNHSLVSVKDNEVAATCKDAGSYDLVIYCFYCETEMSRTKKTIAKLETHTPNNKVIENEIPATCKTEGSYDEVVYCYICDKELSRENKIVEKSGVHTPSAKVTENYVAATCQKKGSYDSVIYCNECRTELSRESRTTPTIDHEYKNGICTSCGFYCASEGLLYEYNRDGTCYVTGLGTCTDAHVVIPPVSPEGYRVTGIGERAFYEICDGFNEDFDNRSITIPPTITYIGADAFRYSFSRVYITDIAAWCNITYENTYSSPLYQGSWLYINNEEPTEIIIPEGVTYIPERAFYGCDRLVSVTIPESVTFIDDYAFRNCYALIEVVNNSSIDITCGSFDNGEVGTYAKEVHSGESKIITYGDFLFYTVGATNYLVGYTGNDTEITLPDSYNGQNYQINDGALFWETNISEIIIPNSVTSIGYKAFYGCSSLTSIEIPDSVTSIDDYAFSSCTGLTSVVIPDSVTSIGYSAFSGCSSLTSVEIPDSVTSIGLGAFSGCTSLTSIVIGDSVTSIGNYAFWDCTSLTSIVIGDSVTSIGYSAFSDCTSLTSIAIPESVTKIGSNAFYNCTRLTNVYYAGTMQNWVNITNGYEIDAKIHSNYNREHDEYGFVYDLQKDDSYYVVGIVGDFADLTIPAIYNGKAVIGIAPYAFYNYGELESVTIPASITVIGDYAFNGCTISKLYYTGTEEQWQKIDIGMYNTRLDGVLREMDPNVFGEDLLVNNIEGSGVVGGNSLVYKPSATGINLGSYGKLNLSGNAGVKDTANRMNYYHGLRTVEDPEDPDNLVLMFTATNKPAFTFTYTSTDEFTDIGFGDTIYPSLTIEFRIGCVDGKPINTGYYYFRNRKPVTGVNWVDLKIFRIVNNQLILADGTVAGMIASEGMTDVSITLDCKTGKVIVYMENADGVMEKKHEGDQLLSDDFKKCYSDMTDFFTNYKLEPTWVFGDGANTNTTLEEASVDLNGDGVMVPLKNADGSFNMDAVRMYAESNYSFLLSGMTWSVDVLTTN